MVARAASPKFLSGERTKRHVSRGHELAKRSEVNPSLVSRGGERRRGQNRRQQAAGCDWERFVASSRWLCHKRVPSANRAPWAKLAAAAGSCVGVSCFGGVAPAGAGGDAGARCW